MSVTREAVEEAKALVAPHIVGAKHVRIRVVTLRRLLTALQAREEENEKLRSQRDALRQQSEVWALEARAHKSSLHEAYQAITGATGEPGNWNGAKPIIEHVTTLQSALAEALGALGKVAALDGEDHKRLCAGREYECSCGFDTQRDEFISDAAAVFQRLTNGEGGGA